MADIQLTRRSVLVAVVAVGLVAAGAGAGTMALFSDQEQSANNTIQAGTLDLSMGESASFVADGDNMNLKPGASTGGDVTLSNTGSLDGTVALNVTYAESDNDESTDNTTDMNATETAKVLDVTELTYGGSPIMENVSDTDGDGTKTLYDLSQSEVDVGALDATEEKDFNVTLTMQESAGNGYQNDGVDATFNFTVTQA
ncbi:putative ribosomally synthesized peptide with SipW-like signal peptide [Halarchaeum rubridurum]|uniref:Cell division protein FtsN n=1 Tax=Halarchaeum rubridurum TaxID=489911 RepID=A0A830FW92_9EURY|nr:TasA family protein [Halarchaeum rubridurum]MBP1953192.1 putative ribosomally synthesized peptide with SipW-like signal peptide [Halarchaeum rubridurum]GGM67132.1 cell division protein FtsN [Halarchaeum rubridurum]